MFADSQSNLRSIEDSQKENTKEHLVKRLHTHTRESSSLPGSARQEKATRECVSEEARGNVLHSIQ